jgi:hypothetical protein
MQREAAGGSGRQREAEGGRGRKHQEAQAGVEWMEGAYQGFRPYDRHVQCQNFKIGSQSGGDSGRVYFKEEAGQRNKLFTHDPTGGKEEGKRRGGREGRSEEKEEKGGEWSRMEENREERRRREEGGGISYSLAFLDHTRSFGANRCKISKIILKVSEFIPATEVPNPAPNPAPKPTG